MLSVGKAPLARREHLFDLQTFKQTVFSHLSCAVFLHVHSSIHFMQSLFTSIRPYHMLFHIHPSIWCSVNSYPFIHPFTHSSKHLTMHFMQCWLMECLFTSIYSSSISIIFFVQIYPSRAVLFSIHLSTHLICQSVHLHMSINLIQFLFTSIHLMQWWFTSSIPPYTNHPFNLSIHPPVFPSIHPYVHPFHAVVIHIIHPSIYQPSI